MIFQILKCMFGFHSWHTSYDYFDAPCVVEKSTNVKGNNSHKTGFKCDERNLKRCSHKCNKVKVLDRTCVHCGKYQKEKKC